MSRSFLAILFTVLGLALCAGLAHAVDGFDNGTIPPVIIITPVEPTPPGTIPPATPTPEWVQVTYCPIHALEGFRR